MANIKTIHYKIGLPSFLSFTTFPSNMLPSQYCENKLSRDQYISFISKSKVSQNFGRLFCEISNFFSNQLHRVDYAFYPDIESSHLEGILLKTKNVVQLLGLQIFSRQGRTLQLLETIIEQQF